MYLISTLSVNNNNRLTYRKHLTFSDTVIILTMLIKLVMFT